MVMVRTMESSQCRAVAVPWAWNARRRGCEGASRGGSVVLWSQAQRVPGLCLGGGGVEVEIAGERGGGG